MNGLWRMPNVFQPRRFRTAARHYLAGRPAYAPRLIRHVARFTGLTRETGFWTWDAGRGCWLAHSRWWGPRWSRSTPNRRCCASPRRRLAAAGEHPVRARQFVRSVAGARAVSAGDDGAFVPVDGPRRDAASAGCDDRAGWARWRCSIAGTGTLRAWTGIAPYRALLHRYAADDRAHVKRQADAWVRTRSVPARFGV